MKKYNKSDIDVQSQFILNRQVYYSSQSPLYIEYPAIRKENQQNYRGYLLINHANPSQSIRQAYINITCYSADKYYRSQLFVEFLLFEILSSAEYQQLSAQQLQTQIFGINKVTQPEKQMFTFINQLKNEFINQKKKLSQIKSTIKEKFHPQWTNLTFKNVEDEKICKDFVLNYLGNKYLWQPSHLKLANLSKLRKGLQANNIKINSKLRFKKDQASYKNESVVFIPLKKYPTLTLKSLKYPILYIEQWTLLLPSFKLLQETDNNALIDKLKAQRIGHKLYIALRKFNKQFGMNYPCLCLQNICYEFQRAQVHLDLLPMIYYILGVEQRYINLGDLFNSTKLSNFEYPFWRSANRLKNRNKFIFPSDSDILWQFIFIVDDYERGHKSYLRRAQTLADLYNRHSKLRDILQANQTHQYFGEYVSRILTYLYNKKQVRWNMFNSESNVGLNILQQFYQGQGAVESQLCT